MQKPGRSWAVPDPPSVPRSPLTAVIWGAAFQIADDLLDASGNTVKIGKTAGKDAAAGKATVVSLLGLEQAAQQARTLSEQAAAHLDGFGPKAQRLRALAGYVVARTY